MDHRKPFAHLYGALKSGDISRREFLQRATAIGMSAAVAGFVVKSLDMKGAAAQDASLSQRPAAGFENTTRGQGGELGILIWQAATLMSPHTATGTKDYLASMFVLESLMNITRDSVLVPTLVKEVPTIENGLLAEDLSSVTYNLLEGVVWSDGEPFTARDVEFTWKWIMNEANASVSLNLYSSIETIEIIDDLTVKLNFKAPTLLWYIPFTGSFGGQIYPGHLWGFDENNLDYINTFRSNPTGTGPYKVESFTENDQVTYVMNENFREANKPYFATVNLKGGGDAVSAAQAVLQTTDYDYAWNLQVEPQILADFVAAGNGILIVDPGVNTETLYLNHCDPNVEVDGQRAEKNTPHPAISDLAVRQALASAIDRDAIAMQFYGEGQPAATDYLVGIPAYDSPHAPFVFDTTAANKILDDAGWVLDGETRKKDGVELSFVYQTSINAVRQKTQAVVKGNLADIGIDVQLKSVDAGIYFDSAEGNDQNTGHFYADLEMYTTGPSYPFPTDYMANFYTGPDGINLAQKSNAWSGDNYSRYQNPDYDALYEEVQATTDVERVAELLIQMNDILVDDVATIPLVQRAASVAAVSNRLLADNISRGPWEGDFWNIMNWIEAAPQ
jgi:peptide/nickel transport system substrate-binding protein